MTEDITTAREIEWKDWILRDDDGNPLLKLRKTEKDAELIREALDDEYELEELEDECTHSWEIITMLDKTTAIAECEWCEALKEKEISKGRYV